MEALLPLATLVGVSGAFLFASRSKPYTKKEGFESLTIPSVLNAVPTQHNVFVEQAASRFNPISNLIDPQNNTLLSPNYSQGELAQVEGKLKDAVRSVVTRPNDPSFSLKPSNTSDIKLNVGSGGSVKSYIGVCEAVKNADCNAFDNPIFAKNCGICHEGGSNSASSPMVGGLFLTDDDRTYADKTAKRMGSRKANYVPTIGKCSPYKFSSTKEQCIRIQNQMLCEKNQSFDNPGCSQCFQDSSFTHLDSSIEQTTPSLQLAGSGSVVITASGDSTNTPIKINLSSSPTKVEFATLQEGDTITLTITTTNNTKPKIAGFLEGTTLSGVFTVDITPLISIDSVSGAKPALGGVLNVGPDPYTLLIPGKGKTSMKLILMNTFTFISAQDEDASKCSSAPFVTKAASATFLNSSPCYKKGQGPGKYSLECLQNTFISAGCLPEGNAYPSSDAAAAKLMVDPSSGKQLTNGQIAAIIYANSLQAYTGKSASGSQLDIPTWDTVSQWCTGVKITNPCSVEGAGPYGPDCLNYLWQNKSATSRIPGDISATYTGPDQIASLDKNTPQYCTPNGTLAPINSNGIPQQRIISQWNSYGSLSNIQNAMDIVNKKANNNSLNDTDHSSYTQQCYGIEFSPIPQNSTPSTTSANCAKGDTGSFSDAVKSEVRALVVNGTIKNYDKCVSHPTVGALASANLLPGDDPRYTNATRWTLCKGYYQNPGWKGGSDTSDDRCPVFTSKTYDSLLDSKTGRTQTPFSTLKPNYIWPTGYTKHTIFVIGPWITEPWASNPSWEAVLKTIPNYLNYYKNMYWIWNIKNSNMSPYPLPNARGIYRLFNNTTDSVQKATFYFVISGTVEYVGINQNTTIFEGKSGVYGTIPISFPPGENLFQVNIKSTGGPAGIIGMCVDSAGNPLFYTDSSWAWMNNSAYSPPPTS
jgi:hypothetical protein